MKDELGIIFWSDSAFNHCEITYEKEPEIGDIVEIFEDGEFFYVKLYDIDRTDDDLLYLFEKMNESEVNSYKRDIKLNELLNIKNKNKNIKLKL